MIATPISTVIRNSKGEYLIAVHWEASTVGRGYIGKSECANAGCIEHILHFHEGQPLGNRLLQLDDCTYGCWASMELPGLGITEQDLQWATAWALQALNHKHLVMKGSNAARQGAGVAARLSQELRDIQKAIDPYGCY